MALGTILSILTTSISSNSFPVSLLLAMIIGVTIGVGLPTTLAYFAESTNIAKRGIHGGITWLVVGLGVLSLGPIIALQQINISSYILAGWRGIGLVLFVLLSRKNIQEKKITSGIVSFKFCRRENFIIPSSLG